MKFFKNIYFIFLYSTFVCCFGMRCDDRIEIIKKLRIQYLCSILKKNYSDQQEFEINKKGNLIKKRKNFKPLPPKTIFIPGKGCIELEKYNKYMRLIN
ncbi:hypothetical protein GF385_03995 [Candidatus Dependentiae bacterium]|nr:hypothetical protein [Candidatus Dependentiae bacterium]